MGARSFKAMGCFGLPAICLCLAGCPSERDPDLSPREIEVGEQGSERAPPPEWRGREEAANAAGGTSVPEAAAVGTEAAVEETGGRAAAAEAATETGAGESQEEQGGGVRLTEEQLADLRRSIRELDRETARRAAEEDAARAAEEEHPAGCACGQGHDHQERPVVARRDIMGPWRVVEVADEIPGETRVLPQGARVSFEPGSYRLWLPAEQPETVEYRIVRAAPSSLIMTTSKFEGPITVTFRDSREVRVADREDRLIMKLAR